MSGARSTRRELPSSARRTVHRRRGRITISLGSHLGALLGLSGLLFISYQMYQVFGPFLSPIAWAIILCLAFQPVHHVLRRRLGNRPNIAALLAIGVVTLAVAIPALVISSILTREA